MIVMEDNEAVIKIVRKGRSTKLRHIQRTHRIVLDWTYDLIRQNDCVWLRYIGTKDQVADLMTKGFLNSTLVTSLSADWCGWVESGGTVGHTHIRFVNRNAR